jgi:hypothetical protein
VAWHASYLTLLDEAGHGDSYVLYDVLHFQRTGEIYREPAQPPFLPAQYSPLLYIVFAAAYASIDVVNPFVGPRLVVLCAFAICVVAASSITHVISGRRFDWALAILIASSVAAMWTSLLQMRADFLGIACSLVSIRLLMSRRPSMVYGAGLCAGLALQFKITVVAATAAGMFWLAWRRDWVALWKFCATAAMSSLGLYVLFWLREPRMLSQILAFVPPVRDVSGAVNLLLFASIEAVALLAMAGVRSIATRDKPAGRLMLVFVAISLPVAFVTSFHAGANINYYFEALFALVPVAVMGVHELTLPSRTLGALALLAVVAVRLLFNVEIIGTRVAGTKSVESRNADFRQVEDVIRRYHVFSTVPRIALSDPAPLLLEPYLLSYLVRTNRINQAPILKPVEDVTFDGILTHARSQTFRGIPLINPQLHAAIADSYEPHCEWNSWLLHLPKRHHTRAEALARDMAAIGCRPHVSGEPRW